jgi:murein DD-endopeptidase MepM/ murein hydrolase activator NlpD
MTAYAAGVIDLGNEPPLVLGAEEKEVERIPAPRAISWRWLTGTVLTGVTSIALMGTALIVAVSNPIRFASLPESLVQSALDAGDIVFGRKGDRLHPTEEPLSNRQIIQVSTVTRQGERDFIKLKPFVKVNATLASASASFLADVPKYDPMTIFADTSEPPAATAAPDMSVAGASVSADAFAAAVDGEVSAKVVDFPIAAADLDPAVTLGDTEVEQIVRAAARLPIGNNTAVAATDAPDDGGPPVPAGVRVVPENVSNVAKSAGIDDGFQEKVIAVGKPENLRQLFADNHVTGDDADEIIAALSQLIDVSRLRPGQKVRIAFVIDPSKVDQADLDADPRTNPEAAAAVEKAMRPIRVSIYADGAHQATVALTDNNVFVRADEPTLTPEVVAAAPAPDAGENDGGPMTLYDAVYATGLEQQVPKPLIDSLIRIFAYDVDLNQRVGLRDSIEVFHSLPDAADKDDATPEILFAALNLGGVEKRLYRFTTPDDGVTDYYDEDGRSAKKFLIRKPLTVNARISSPFGWRVHPILGYRILHAGVDYAAPRGTPILAAGNGVVERAGPSNGYGNFTLIRHTNGYETAYGHQTAFAKGIAPGVTVHQGQVIGYVGSTGRSTGPHVHFEIRVNGKPVDPLRIRLPRGRVLEGDFLATFEHERDRIDQLLGDGTPSSSSVASLVTGEQP